MEMTFSSFLTKIAIITILFVLNTANLSDLDAGYDKNNGLGIEARSGSEVLDSNLDLSSRLRRLASSSTSSSSSSASSSSTLSSLLSHLIIPSSLGSSPLSHPQTSTYTYSNGDKSSVSLLILHLLFS
jgi:hypothetical protein